MKTTPLSLNEIEIQHALGMYVSSYDIEQLKRYTYGIRRPETLEIFYRKLQKLFLSDHSVTGDYIDRKVRLLIQDYVVTHKYCSSELRDEIIEQYFLGDKRIFPKNSWFSPYATEEVMTWANTQI